MTDLTDSTAAADSEAAPETSPEAPVEEVEESAAPAAAVETTVSTERPLYVHQGGGPVDATLWPAARVKAADGSTLYTFIGDAYGGPATGTSADWAEYDGETVPV